MAKFQDPFESILKITSNSKDLEKLIYQALKNFKIG